MEINLSCQGTVGKTIAFDLCYLSAICIHKRLLFIIIVFFLLSSCPISGFLQAYFVSFISLLLPYHTMGVGMCYIGLTLREASQAQKLRCSVFKATAYFYIKNGSHVLLYVKAVAHTEFPLNSVVAFSSTDCLKGLTVHRCDFPTCNFTVLVHSSINVVFCCSKQLFSQKYLKISPYATFSSALNS